MNAIILAGGQGKRFGKDKKLIKLSGEYILSMQFTALSKIFDKVILITNDNVNTDLDFFKIVKDQILGIGPLMGIYSALCKTDKKENFIIACDMPFINTKLIEFMKRYAGTYDAVCPKINNRLEPLYSFYSTTCIDVIKDELDKGNRKVFSIFDKLNTKYIGEDKIKLFEADEQSFFNINFTKDLRKAERIK